MRFSRVLATLVPALFISLPLAAQFPNSPVIPGVRVGGSANVHPIGHLQLDSAHKTADITIEQELSRPYAYIAHRLVPSGIEIISIKNPSKPVLLWKWFVENAELHK